MTTRRLSAFLDALAAGRRPRPFRADPDDVEMLRVAIDLRAARPGDGVPDETFVAELHEQLAQDLSPAEQTNIHPLKMRRGRVALVSVAAGLALVGGTLAVAETTNKPTVQQSATAVPQGRALRTASFQSPTGQVVGQIVLYHGHPSWVYMTGP
jgi:cytochrome b6-f complex iron-sulfur subunit